MTFIPYLKDTARCLESCYSDLMDSIEPGYPVITFDQLRRWHQSCVCTLQKGAKIVSQRRALLVQNKSNFTVVAAEEENEDLLDFFVAI